jgi:hypothetical protein
MRWVNELTKAAFRLDTVRGQTLLADHAPVADPAVLERVFYTGGEEEPV